MRKFNQFNINPFYPKCCNPEPKSRYSTYKREQLTVRSRTGLTIFNNQALNLPHFGRFQVWHKVGSFRKDFKMKKLSHKDLIIALGIAVAAIIIITSIYFKDSAIQSDRSSSQPVPTGKAKPTVLVKKVLERLASKAQL
jgi:hypothetical protein